jgi:Ca-activated chloride channel family protein
VLALEAATISAPAEPRKSAALPATVMPVAASPTAGAAISRTRQTASAPARDMAMPMSGTVRDARTVANREQYDRIEDNPFLGVRTNPLSTFSIDVDRASYGNVRRFLTSGQRPPKDAVRIEELINYFPYELPEPRGSDPVAITSEVMTAPWQPQHRLVRIALQARRIETANLPPNNLVFLIDVSGSMNEWNKLPLVKQSLRLLVNELRPQDRVAIVAYAGAAGLVLPSTSGDEKVRIADAIDRLEAGGSTAGGAGIELAYRTAREHFLERGNNRVILATDGDFNVGVSSDAELERLVEQRRRDGTYLTVLGFGTGNYQAAKMEKLAKVGNGNAGYVDSPAEARKLLVEEMGATLLTVANDVKLQVEFNPSRVQAYRLIGYENRLLSTEDFNDDAKDAGDIGTGHQVTALYEVVPVGVDGTVPVRGVDSLRYVAPDATVRSTTRGPSDELLFVKLRYKRPGNSASQLLSHAVPSRISARPSTDARFIAAVASFGMLLRDSEYKGNSSAAQVLEQARAALGEDRGGYRAEFVGLVERWRALGVTAGERR